jgi:hypothetical protein
MIHNSADASRQALKHAERRFPVRIRIGVPPQGLGRQINMMHGWLDQHAGRDAYAIHGADHLTSPGQADHVYFIDIGLAAAFVDRFACGLASLAHAGQPVGLEKSGSSVVIPGQVLVRGEIPKRCLLQRAAHHSEAPANCQCGEAGAEWPGHAFPHRPSGGEQ